MNNKYLPLTKIYYLINLINYLISTHTNFKDTKSQNSNNFNLKELKKKLGNLSRNSIYLKRRKGFE